VRGTGLPASWTAHWVEPTEPEGLSDVQRPAYHLAGELSLTAAPTQAVLHVTARGLYEAFVNGERVSDAELTPGFTAYRKRLQVQSYDVTALMRTGENVIGALLSDGWWRGQTTVARRTNGFGDTVALHAELHITTASGETLVFGTDESWRWTTGHILGADLIAGERHDLRLVLPAWSEPGTDRSSWTPVRVAAHSTDMLCPTLGPPVRRIEELPAVSVREVAPGRHIVDFGRVSNGWIRLTDLGPAGTQLTIEHAEALNAAGDDVANEAHAVETFLVERDTPVPFQTDVVISAGKGSTFEPRHSTKGFRYVRVDGHPGPLDPSAFTSIVVRNDLTPIGSFECSDNDLNALHRAAEWSLLTNACDIPTDCPTRERAGWTGDWQIYVATAAYLYDVTDFSRKWLEDLRAEQFDSGAVLHFVPDPTDFTLERTQWWKDMQGSAGWGDAAVHVPWQLYLATGRTDLLAESFESMRKWVDFAAETAASGRHPDRAEARPVPAEHEQYLWDSGFHFGEWNEPGFSGADQIELIKVMDHGPTATAYLFRSADEVARIAAILGDDTSAAHYATLATRAREAWQREFLDADGRVVPATQANLVRALAFGLVPEDQRPQAVDDLVKVIREAGTRIGTGFLSTPFLLPVLADNGELELAYELLLQRTPPSWLGMLDAGATTIWEAWEAVKADGTVECSLNHFSMGAVISFMHRYTAGLQSLAPGYTQFRVQPRPGGGVTSARTSHHSPHGRIDVTWSLEQEQGVIDVQVPEGTQAELVLPGGTEMLEAGSHSRIWTWQG
jgi:alpha-L-rhamnosidase